MTARWPTFDLVIHRRSLSERQSALHPATTQGGLGATLTPVRSRPYFQRLHQCHLVVNVYKHGEGISFEKLHKDAPQFLKRDDFPEPLLRFPPDYTNLTVTDDDLDRFSGAIVAFWQDVPENTFASQIGNLPKWLEKAIEKDRPEV